MNRYPGTWRLRSLGDICSKIGSGATPRGGERAYKSSGTPLIRSMNVHFDGFRSKGLAYLDDDQAAALKGVTVRPGDVLLNITGASIGRVTQAPPEMDGARVNQHVCIIRPNEDTEPAFVARYLASPSMQAFIAGENYGVTRQALTKEAIENIVLPLPGRNEQRRIVAKLDRLFARSKSAHEELALIPHLAERCKHAILAAALRGDATRKWRAAHPSIHSASLVETPNARGARRREGSNSPVDSSDLISLPETWRAVTVDSIGEVILGRQRSPENHTGPHMRPYVRAANIKWDGWDLSDVKEMNFDESDFAKFRLKAGDVLINEGSGSAAEVGKPAIWNDEIKNCCFQNTLIAVRPHSVSSEFLYYALLSAAKSKAFVDQARGVNIHHIGRAGLAQFVIPMPPREEQEEIANQIRASLKRVDHLMSEATRATELLSRLEGATLAKAFKGELLELSRTA